MATKELKLRVPEKLLPYFDENTRNLELQLVEDLVANLVRHGRISVVEAAEILECEPDQILTPEEESIVKRGEAEQAAGKVSDWEDVKRRLNL